LIEVIANLVKIELMKIMRRRSLLIIFLVTCAVFPLAAKITSHFISIDKGAIEGLFAEQMALLMILFCAFILSLPMWVTFFVGQEFDNGHVNRAVFLTSRKTYFLSKVIYCVLLSLFFTVLAIVSFVISVHVSAFPTLVISPKFVGGLAAQVLLFNILNSLTILCVTFALRRPKLATALVYLVMRMDDFAYHFLNMTTGARLPFLRVFGILYTRSPKDYRGGLSLDYYNPLLEAPLDVLPSVAFVAAILYLSYRWFLRRNLKPISD
jgi:hypothetical protein